MKFCGLTCDLQNMSNMEINSGSSSHSGVKQYADMGDTVLCTILVLSGSAPDKKG